MSAVARLSCSNALKRPQALTRRPVATIASVLADGSLAARRITTAAHLPAFSAARAPQSSALKLAASFVPARTFAGPAVKAVPGSTIPFLLADIGEGIAEVEVLKWFIKAGDHVSQFQKVCEVQSDKATVEITSRYDGLVEKVCYDVGQMAKVGAPLIFLKLSGAADGAAPTPSAPTPSTPAASQSPAKPAHAPAASTEDLSEINDKVLATPATRRLAREHSIDLRRVRPSGHDGRVMKEDVLAFLSGAQPAVTPAAAHPAHTDVSAPSATIKVSSNVPPPTPTPAGPAPKSMTQKKQEAMPVYLSQDQVQPVTGIQRAMAAQMTKTVAIPTFLYCDEVLMDELVELRARCKPAAERFGIKLSYFPFIIKAASLALRRYPIVNSHVNADCTQVTLRAAHNIGIAMDTPRGLIVPNIKNVQEKTILEIAADLTRLQALGAEGRLGKEDLTGGTFSLSNIGSVGGTYAGPILNVPEVAIGALGKFQVVPRFNEKKELYPAHILNVSWTGDHRILDGATIASFSNAWKRFLEHPTSMILETK